MYCRNEYKTSKKKKSVYRKSPNTYYDEYCIDDCMTDLINEQFDWWGGWVEFVIAPGPVVGWMAGGCIYDCHLSN